MDPTPPVAPEIRTVSRREMFAAGEGVSELAVGDRVFGVLMKSDLHDGSIGEFVTVPTTIGLAGVPEGTGRS